MGASYTVLESGWDGSTSRTTRLRAAFDASYVAGGEALTPSNAQLDQIEKVFVEETVTESGYVVSYDVSAGVLKVYASPGSTGDPLTEVADGTDLSIETVTLTVIGRS